ncbi:DNA circularization N-terminal domain-containing protein [Jeongeupia wiesaeckerbachi]|uniref:DNA circularization protein n=1 Tax=Jeongeupia wiesaeckerbachi TaxID=3051218 RepID=UPI003D800BD2
MNWRNQLQTAQFRGVEFHTQKSSGEIGRRVQLTEYPLRDTPYAEDLGRKARTFSLDAFVIGADYMARRDKLIAAFETPGPGELIHPYQGAINVVVTRVSIEESSDQGGMARFNVEFTEAGENAFPNTKVDTSAALDSSADRALADASADFARRWNRISESILLSDARPASLDDLAGLAGAGLAFVDMVAGAARKAENLLDAVLYPVSTLVKLPGELFSRLNDSVARIESRLSTTANALQMSASIAPLIYQTAPNRPFLFPTLPVTPLPPWVVPVPVPTQANRPVIRPTTPANITLINSAQALDTAIKTIAAVQLAKAIISTPASSTQPAPRPGSSTQTAPAPIAAADLIALRDDALDAIDSLIETASDQSYRSLLALKRATMAAAANRLASATALITITPRLRTPALVLAWRQTADLAAEADLIARNRVRHPGFVPGGRPIQLLKE